MRIATLIPANVRGEGRIGFRSLDGFREQRLIAYENAKGRHYLRRRNDATRERQPVNLTQQQWRTLVPFLAMNAPLADVTPLRADLEFEAKVRKQLYDRDASRLKLDDVYQDASTEAIFSGIALTLNGIKSGGDTFLSKNRRIDVGQEFCRVLDWDDVALDPMAKTLDECRFIAHRYSVSREDALAACEEGTYGAMPQDYEDGLLPNPNLANPEEAAQIIESIPAIEVYGRRADRVDDNDGERIVSGERLEDTILLWDFVFYIHGEVWIATLPANPGPSDPFHVCDPDKFLALYRWRGPASGPINRLTFLRVPFNKLPVALEAMQRDLAEISDLIANKVVRQILRTKKFTIYEGSQEDTAQAMRSSAEGAMIRGNPGAFAEVTQGGLIPDMIPGAQFFADQWQNATGNLAMAAGSGDIGKTATAFEGLMGRIQGFLDFLRTRVEQLATDDLCVRSWFLSNNPALARTVNQTIGQQPYAVTAQIQVAAPGAPQAQMADHVLQGDHEDFDIKVRAFSMQYTNPVISAQQVSNAIEKIVPIIAQLGAQGIINGRVAISILARKLNEPDLENLIPDPVIAMLQQQESSMMPGLDADPSGMGENQTQQDGPAGRRLPTAGRRAMRPGPGQGSPRPMQGARPTGPMGMGERAAA